LHLGAQRNVDRNPSGITRPLRYNLGRLIAAKSLSAKQFLLIETPGQVDKIDSKHRKS
jgi:hypothetical protein